MACYHPVPAWLTEAGDVVFSERAGAARSLFLPCGQCVGCRLERSRMWATRCMHESKMHDKNCFITITYSAEYLPAFGSLCYPDFQDFMKRLRGRFAPVRVRFYMCGEYGEVGYRPHYHACLFGINFIDRKYVGKSPSGSPLYSSKLLEELWPFGWCSVGEVNFESAAYVARYCMKKVTGRWASLWYQVIDQESGEIGYRVPEFARMSLKPGIGARWLEKFGSDVYPHGKCVVRGHEVNPPRFYDKMFAKTDPDGYEALVEKRRMDGEARAEDSTYERLAVREQVAKARLKSLERKI